MGFLLPCLVASALVSAPEFEVQPVDGSPVRGQIHSLDGKQLTLLVTSSSAAAPTSLTLPLAQVAGIVQCDKPRPRAESEAIAVQLANGSDLQATSYTVKTIPEKGSIAQLRFFGGDVLSVPAESVLSVRLQHGSESALAEWARILAAKSVGDLLVTSKQGNLDFHQGVIHDVSETHVDFEVDGETLHVKREKVYGLQYYHKTSDSAAPIPGNENTLRVIESDASQWILPEVKVEPGSDTLSWSPVLASSGNATSAPSPLRQRTLGSIYSIDLSRGKIVYLSDLKPEKTDFTPFFPLQNELASRTEMFRARNDQNLLSRPLQIQGQEFRKGLSMHSRSELAWSVPEGFTHLVACAGIDDEVRPQGSVRLVIRGDDKVLFDEPISGVDAPKNIRLSIDGFHRLTILADFGDTNGVSGHLDLGNARLFK